MGRVQEAQHRALLEVRPPTGGEAARHVAAVAIPVAEVADFLVKLAPVAGDAVALEEAAVGFRGIEGLTKGVEIGSVSKDETLAPWKVNPNGLARSPAEAVRIVQSRGIEVPDWVKIVPDP